VAQRVSFDDPDLTFSFKKSKKWKMVDDGLNISIYPKKPTEEIQQINITYFENASGESFEDVSLADNIKFKHEMLASNRPNYTLIETQKRGSEDDETHIYTYSYEEGEKVIFNRTYYFMRHNQRFELTSMASTLETLDEMNDEIAKIISTLIVEMK
jgi:hypothetical protein